MTTVMTKKRPTLHLFKDAPPVAKPNPPVVERQPVKRPQAFVSLAEQRKPLVDRLKNIDSDGVKLQYKTQIIATAIATHSGLGLEARLTGVYLLSVSTPRLYGSGLGFIVGVAMMTTDHVQKRLRFPVEAALAELAKAGIIRRDENPLGGERIHFVEDYLVRELRKAHDYHEERKLEKARFTKEERQ